MMFGRFSATLVLLSLVPLGMGGASSRPATEPAIEMIFWEKQSWESGGSQERLTLWADGRSQVRIRQLGKAEKTKAGWTACEDKSWTIYTKESPYSNEAACAKFSAAIAAGIDHLRTFPVNYTDGSGTLCGVSAGGHVKQTLIPMFLHEGAKDDKGSENHRTFLAIEKILGGFDVDPVDR